MSVTPRNLQDLVARCEKSLPAALDHLRDAVSINSFTLNKPGVDAVAKLTREAFQPLGFDGEQVASDDPAYASWMNDMFPVKAEGVLVRQVDYSRPRKFLKTSPNAPLR